MTEKFYCLNCLHYQRDGKCAAFPDGIPEPILFGDALHGEPHKGDHGIRYEPLFTTEPEPAG